MLDTRYPFLSSYLKGAEAKLITSSHISRLTQTSGLQDILAVIKDTNIGSYLNGVLAETFDVLDEHLWLYLGDCIERVEWFKPVPADMLKLLEAYTLKYDVLNIKAALQGISSNSKTQRIPIGVIHNNGLLDELSQAENIDGIIAVLTRCKLGDYASILEENKTDEGIESLPMAEARLDGKYYQNLLDVTRGINDGTILAKVFGAMIDMKNLQVALRAVINGSGTLAASYIINGGYMFSSEAIKELLALKASDIPNRLENTQYHNIAEEVIDSYDRTKSLTVVDEIMVKHQFRLDQGVLSPRVQSPLMIAWYLILKETEIRNLRLILKAMFDNIPVEEIKNYLVLAS
ncbi:V-type ATPase subunit [Chloroflexota bacterium]